MKLIINPTINHVAQDVIREFESTIKKYCAITTVPVKWQFFGKIFSKLYERLHFKDSSSPCFFWRRGGNFFIIMMGLQSHYCFPYFLTARKKSIYLFDAWPKYYDKIESFINIWGVQNVFFSSLQVAEYFNDKVTANFFGFRKGWIPHDIRSMTINKRI